MVIPLGFCLCFENHINKLLSITTSLKKVLDLEYVKKLGSVNIIFPNSQFLIRVSLTLGELEA